VWLLLAGFALAFALRRFDGSCWRRLTASRVIDIVFQACWRSYRDYAGSKLDSNGDIVVGNEASFAEADGQLQEGNQRGCWEVRKIRRHALDLPEPESPIVTILLMKLYGCVGCAIAKAKFGRRRRYASTLARRRSRDLRWNARIQLPGMRARYQYVWQ
jgi:hypothetical protein